MSFDLLIRRIGQLEGSVVELTRRLNNVMREARVLEVDPSTGMAIVEAHGGKTKPVPWLQRAGSIRDWDPPTPGERVILLSPGGDPGRGMILPGGFSEQFAAPHNQLGQSMRAIGAGTDLFTADERVIEHQIITLRGTLRVEGAVEITGPSVTHNGTNIGDTHVHGGVERGGATTNRPQ